MVQCVNESDDLPKDKERETADDKNTRIFGRLAGRESKSRTRRESCRRT
jgi:hypothetical protein